MPRQLPVTCYVVGVSILLFMALSMLLIVAIHLNEVPLLGRSPLLRTVAMCGAFGMLGASIASIRKYYRVLITESTARELGQEVSESTWDFGWAFYYITRPILGAILGALAFIITFILFQLLSTARESAISSQGNLMLYAVSLLSGYAVSQVLDRLSSVAKQIFAPLNGEKEQ